MEDLTVTLVPKAASGVDFLTGSSLKTVSKAAGYPFDDPRADIILRSSDDIPIDFHVFKLILSLASPFFDLAFTLPQPANADGASSIPVVLMAEDARTLELVLGLCFPVSVKKLPTFSQLEDVQLVMKAAAKFEMEGIQRHIRTVLEEPRFIEVMPLRVFALACHYGWAKVAKNAARLTLRYSTAASDEIASELGLIPASTYHRLLRYQRKCGEAAAAYVGSQARKNPDENWAWETCTACTKLPTKNMKKIKEGGPGMRGWWLDWMQSIREEVTKRPCGKAISSFDLRHAALSKAQKCDYCRDNAAEDLDAFSTILATGVERMISEVSQGFVPCRSRCNMMMSKQVELDLALSCP